MATYTVRGNAHNIVYRIKTEEGDDKQQWETYDSKLDAALYVAATEYKKQRAEQQAAKRKT